ncbi:acyl-CoA synthetase [Enemella sp. A6]|uniref:acyl-CoA synthetase n=1 Tax=Enemella sp. A6 TaxID=3440152 RepID=UPI003EBE8815
MALTIADLFEHTVDVVPDRLALIVGDVRLSYAELGAAANRFADHLRKVGVEPGQHVGLMAANTSEHVIAMLGCFKARVVPINVNYRYLEAELDYLFGNSEIVALVLEGRFAAVVDPILTRHPRLHEVVVIEDGSAPPTSREFTTWADVLAGGNPVRPQIERSDDDLYIVYTGGTTGYPKGVMWRQADVWRTLGGGRDFVTRELLGEYDQSRAAAAVETPQVAMHLGPIMHANGQWGLLLRLFTGHTSVLLPKFDPVEVWRTVEREGVNTMSLIGDAMARPLIEEYERGGWKAEGFTTVTSGAAVLSAEVKRRWLTTFPGLRLIDVIGSSETGMTGNAPVRLDDPTEQGTLVSAGPGTLVLDDDNRVMDLDTEIGATGRMATSGHIPVGYFGDPEKTAATFPTIDGVRYAVPGDVVRIEPGRRLTLLGRGSACINTGGEKVYPDEVEAVIKSHPSVFDTLVIGLPDPRFGQQVAAVVQARPGAEVDHEQLRDHVRGQLSGYKVPRTVVTVAQVPRHETGKADYTSAKKLAEELLERQTS